MIRTNPTPSTYTERGPLLPGAAAAGTFLLVRDIGTGECRAYELVTHAEADANQGQLSIHSPIGRALASARIGTRFEMDTIHGPRKLQLISAEHQLAW